MTDKYRRNNGRRDPYFSDPVTADHHRSPSHDDENNRYSQRDEEYRDQYWQSDQHGLESHADSTNSRYRQPQSDRDLQINQNRRDRQSGHDNYDEKYRHYRDHGGSENYHPDSLKNYPFQFHGKTSEYFKIWIVNLFLTIITLYIYSAWAKVRTKRYFYGNTTLDGSSFEYHAKGGQLVIGRLIGAALLITYTFFQGINATVSLTALGILALVFPWAIWRSLRFNAKASSFRNIHFGFEGQASPPYLNILVIPLFIFGIIGLVAYFFIQKYSIFDLEQFTNLPDQTLDIIASVFLVGLILVMVLIVPKLHKNLISYSLTNHHYGTARFSANIKTSRIYGIHFLTSLISLMAFIAIGAAVFTLARLYAQSGSVLDNSDANILSATAAYLVVIPVIGIAVAYFRSRIRNHRYNATRIESGVRLISTVGLWSLWWLNISNLAILLLSLGLAYPYTKIRSARYYANHTSVTIAGGLDSFTERERTKLHAMGEEMADAFDIGFDIGV